MRTDLTILQVNAQDAGGGAERVASALFENYRRRGLRSYMAVGRKLGDDPDVFRVATGEGRGRAYRAWRRVADKVGGIRRVIDEWQGHESFHYPATYRLPALSSRRPDVIHVHNMHGGYFDLRALPRLGQQAPLVLTLHDAWLLSGHCSHSFDCERWKSGCGACPDLSIYPAIRRDATAFNWRRKQSIYARSRLYVATPSEWLMNRVNESMLDPAIVKRRVIPNGVDLDAFRPADRRAARQVLDIEPEAHVLLHTASGGRRNEFKDFETMLQAATSIASTNERHTILLVLGGSVQRDRTGDIDIRYVPYQTDLAAVARYYHAADLYLHAARAENFPMTVLEALACGTPVVATAVGGIPEQIRSLDSAPNGNAHSVEHATGVLVAPEDGVAMAEAASRLLNSEDLRRQLGENARRDAAFRFDVRSQCDAYLAWYDEILETPEA